MVKIFHQAIQFLNLDISLDQSITNRALTNVIGRALVKWGVNIASPRDVFYPVDYSPRGKPHLSIAPTLYDRQCPSNYTGIGAECLVSLFVNCEINWRVSLIYYTFSMKIILESSFHLSNNLSTLLFEWWW